jgi:hypothetical protein
VDDHAGAVDDASEGKVTGGGDSRLDACHEVVGRLAGPNLLAGLGKRFADRGYYHGARFDLCQGNQSLILEQAVDTGERTKLI